MSEDDKFVIKDQGKHVLSTNYECPKHGKVDGKYITVMLDGENSTYCLECWNDHLSKVCEEVVEDLKDGDGRYPDSDTS